VVRKDQSISSRISERVQRRAADSTSVNGPTAATKNATLNKSNRIDVFSSEYKDGKNQNSKKGKNGFEMGGRIPLRG